MNKAQPQQQNKLQQLLTLQQMAFHNQQTNHIRTSIKGCSYCAYERYKDSYWVVTVINGQREEFALSGAPSDTDAGSYKKLLTLIKDHYGIA